MDNTIDVVLSVSTFFVLSIFSSVSLFRAYNELFSCCCWKNLIFAPGLCLLISSSLLMNAARVVSFSLLLFLERCDLDFYVAR
jgi:hypothetical protein